MVIRQYDGKCVTFLKYRSQTMSRLHLQHCVLLIGHIIFYQYAVPYAHRYCHAHFGYEVSFDANLYRLPLPFLLLLLIITPLNVFFTGVRAFLALLDMAGFLLHDCFPGTIKMPHPAPTCKIGFRTVTRGDYPKLILENVAHNKATCERAGLENYVLEIATEKEIAELRGLEATDDVIRQIVIPSDYVTPHGTLFKGRNLHYCLQDGVSRLEDSDWIVHLDEDSLLTVEAVNGICKFISEGRHRIGQGAVNYDPEEITSHAIQCMIAMRIGFDYGVNKTLGHHLSERNAGIKGSFIVANVQTEKKIGFDGGLEASILEFIWFALTANQKGIGVGCVDGVIMELGTLDLSQNVAQNTRVAYGFRMLLKETKGLLLTNYWTLALYCRFLSHIVYNVTFFLNFFVRVGYLSDALLIAQALIMASDAYVGFLHVLLRRKRFEASLAFICLTHNLVGHLYRNLVLSYCVVKSLLQKEIKFAITKKTA